MNEHGLSLLAAAVRSPVSVAPPPRLERRRAPALLPRTLSMHQFTRDFSRLRLHPSASGGDALDGPIGGGLPPRPAATAVPPATGNACPTAVGLGAVRRFSHADLPAAEQARFRTYLGTVTRMDLRPGPDHTGHCIQEVISLDFNTCPASLTSATQPCSGHACLPLDRSGGDGPTRTMMAAGRASFLDLHRSRSARSLLEGTGRSSCTVVCRQTYFCDSESGPQLSGMFQIVRSYQAGTWTPPGGGTPLHITSGVVSKIPLAGRLDPGVLDLPRLLPEGQELA